MKAALFQLTKPEQRAAIIIMLVLLIGAVAAKIRRGQEDRSLLKPVPLAPTPAVSPNDPPPE